MWKKESDQKVVHKEGYSIELLDGTWQVPMNINPNFPSGLPPVVVARLLRDGMRYAARQNSLNSSRVKVESYDQRNNSSTKKTARSWNRLFAGGMA